MSIDDHAPAARESYHDQVAISVASRLVKNPEIMDAGPGAARIAAETAVGGEKRPDGEVSRNPDQVKE